MQHCIICVCFYFFSSNFQRLHYLGQWSAVLINFPNTGAVRQSGNPSRTVGNGHSNNNNTKYNLNYALKRLGQNNPQNKHKWGGGRPFVIKCREGSHIACVCMFVFLAVGFVESCVDFWCKSGVYFGMDIFN